MEATDEAPGGTLNADGDTEYDLNDPRDRRDFTTARIKGHERGTDPEGD